VSYLFWFLTALDRIILCEVGSVSGRVCGGGGGV
jgi:hypothetical protein